MKLKAMSEESHKQSGRCLSKFRSKLVQLARKHIYACLEMRKIGKCDDVGNDRSTSFLDCGDSFTHTQICQTLPKLDTVNR